MPGCSVVVPYVGTWIEMLLSVYMKRMLEVVPYVGTWIEIEIKILLILPW